MTIVNNFCIILLNWHGWQDTIDCLQSLLLLEQSEFNVIVCDNGSTDNSFSHIQQWAADNWSGFFLYLDKPGAQPSLPLKFEQRNLLLIQTGANLGFAGGNNVGVRFALAHLNPQWFWFLNNDTVILPDTLTQLHASANQNAAIGICGSTLVFEDHRNTIQACGGGHYRPMFGLTHEIGNGHPWKSGADLTQFITPLDYVSGASMLVSRPFIDKVGLMQEDYFLYFEELDWAVRGKRAGFQMGYAPLSIVFHKEGAKIGSGRSKKRSKLAEFYGIRNRLIFTQRFFPVYLPTVYLMAWIQTSKRLLTGEFGRAALMASILLGRRKF